MRFILGILLVYLSINVVARNDSDTAEVEPSCRARAWVRAPDLVPGQVIQGDVKVKLDGPCADVLNYTLRLRFAERSWVKTKREGVELPGHPNENPSSSKLAPNKSILDPDLMLGNPFWRVKNPALAQYEDDLRNSDLWFTREEERVGFEAQYDLGDGKTLGEDVIESFAILVPATNYPPAFAPLWSRSSDSRDASGTEHVYSYFVDVSFVDGKVLAVPAGYTSFSPQTEAAPTTPLPGTFNVTLKPGTPSNTDAEVDVDVFTLEVTFSQGRHFEQGSINNITIVSHQAGPGREHPDRIEVLYLDIFQQHHWAASFAADNETAKRILDSGKQYSFQMKPTKPLQELSHSFYHHDADKGLTRPKFSQDGAVTNGSMFSTKPVIAQFHVPDNCYPSFEMQYQTAEVELLIRLIVKAAADSSHGDLEDEEDHDWIPTVKQPPVTEFFWPAHIPLFIHSKHEEPTKLPPDEIDHYLSPEARVPIFVDPNSVKDLQQKSLKERNALTPKAQPTVITHDGDDIIKERYTVRGLQDPPEMRYVGDNWYRKVVLPSEKTEQEAVGLRVQS